MSSWHCILYPRSSSGYKMFQSRPLRRCCLFSCSVIRCHWNLDLTTNIDKISFMSSSEGSRARRTAWKWNCLLLLLLPFLYIISWLVRWRTHSLCDRSERRKKHMFQKFIMRQSDRRSQFTRKLWGRGQNDGKDLYGLVLLVIKLCD